MRPAEIGISRDWSAAPGWSSDGILLDCSPKVLDFFQTVQILAPKWAEQPYFRDKSAIEETARLPRYHGLIHELPSNILGAVPASTGWSGIVNPWKEGDLLAHITGIDMERRLNVIRDLLPFF